MFSRFNSDQDIPFRRKRWVRSLTVFLFLVVGGCGGGGGSGLTSLLPTPTVQQTLALSQLRIGVWANFIDWSGCSVFEDTGARWTYVEIVWSAVESQQGVFDWSMIDSLVQQAEACHVELVLKVRTGQLAWATTHEGPIGVGERPSAPPKNPEDYKRFIDGLVTHLQGKVTRYAIENEVTSPSWWAGTADEYHDLLVAAHDAIAAIKTADPSVEVEIADFGVASGAYGPVITQSIYNASGSQDAISFWNRYAAHRTDERITTEEELQAWLNQNQALIDRVASHLQNDLPYFDIYQLHFYEEWDLLPTVVAWIKDRIGGSKPIEAWEMGYAWEAANYDASDHAQDLARLTAEALQEDVQRICYLPYKADPDTAEIWRGLYDPVTGDPRPALRTYQTLVNKISSAIELEILDFSDPDIHGYRFDLPSGGPVYLVWAADSKQIRLLTGTAAVVLTDYLGNLSSGDPSRLSITALPTFVGE